MITVRYRSSDNCRQNRKFKTLAGARKFAHYWIGEHPDIGTSYAGSNDGIGTIRVEGAALADLFPPKVDHATLKDAITAAIKAGLSPKEFRRLAEQVADELTTKGDNDNAQAV